MQYTSCFIGIPLPEEYEREFAGIVKSIGNLDARFHPVNPNTPHITLYYLSVQSQNHISEIAAELERTKEILSSAQVTTGGLGLFGGDEPRVLFLKAECSPEVAKANQIYTELFDSYYARDNNLPFHPHMTLAKLPNENAQTAFKEQRSSIEELCDVSWHFPVSEIVIFGVDSSQDPEVHQRLHTVKISGAFA